MIPIQHLTLTVSDDLFSKFFQLLEQGFLVESSVGCSLRDFICSGLGLDEQYLADRVQTIFLDHNPVDNIDTARIHEGSTVALSAAMPGLAGATLRKGGRFAAMRNQISCQTGTACKSDRRTQLTVKFFNAVARELGESFYRKGLWLKGSSLQWFFSKYLQGPLSGIQKVRINDREFDTYNFAGMTWCEAVFIQLLSDSGKSSDPSGVG
ncbi:MAG: hypothetical protein AB1427_18040 [Thermodesulfobacteriota bacterium]